MKFVIEDDSLSRVSLAFKLAAEYIVNVGQAVIALGFFAYAEQKTGSSLLVFWRYLFSLGIMLYVVHFPMEAILEFGRQSPPRADGKYEIRLRYFVLLNVVLLFVLGAAFAAVLFIPSIISPLVTS